MEERALKNHLSSRSTIQAVFDRMAIEDVLLRYFHAVDSCHYDMLTSVFSEDVRAVYGGVPKPAKLESLIDTFRRRDGALKLTGGRPLKLSMHFVGNMQVQVDSDSADTETYVIAHLVYQAGDRDCLIVRGLRYLDHLVRTSAGWRIQQRTHTVDWMREEDLTFATSFSERVQRQMASTRDRFQ